MPLLKHDYQYRSLTGALALTPWVHSLLLPHALGFQHEHPDGFQPGQWWQGDRMPVLGPTWVWRNDDWAGWAGGLTAVLTGHRRILLPIADTMLARAVDQYESDPIWIRGRLVIYLDEAEAIWYARLAYKTTKLPPKNPRPRPRYAT